MWRFANCDLHDQKKNGKGCVQNLKTSETTSFNSDGKELTIDTTRCKGFFLCVGESAIRY